MKSFMLKVSCLTANYEYVEGVKLEEWKLVIAYMKSQIHKDQDNPKQLIDKIAKVFKKAYEHNKADSFSFSKVKLHKYSKVPSFDEKGLNSARKK